MRCCCDLFRHGCCRSFGNGCSDGCWCLNGDLFFARSRSCRRLYHHASRRRCHDNNRARGNNPRGGLGDNCADGRTRGNSWGGRRRSDNGWRRARLRNDLARLWLGWSGCGGLRGHRSNGGWHNSFGRCNRRRLPRNTRVARLFLFFLLLGLNSLQHVSRFGDVREIDLGSNGFSAVASVSTARMRCRLRLMHKVRTNLLRLVQLQRAAVRLARRNAELRKNVQNRPRLDFQLFREIVDSNLTHPPLFNLCRRMAAQFLIAASSH